MRISPKLKLFNVDLYGFLAVASICGLMFFLLIKPLKEKHKAIIQNQQASHQETTRTQEKLNHLTVMLEKQKQLSNRLIQTRDILLENSGVDGVIRKIELLAQENNLVLEEITPQDEQIHPPYRINILSLFLEGLFPDMRSLLTHLQIKLPYVRIDELSLSTKKSSDTGLCRIHLSLVIFSPQIID